MSASERVLSEFIDAWMAGRRPRMRDYLTRVGDDEREPLAEQIAVWLEVAPTPDFDAATRAAVRAEPAVQRALGGANELIVLRERRGWSVAQLAERLVSGFGLPRGDTSRAADYLTQLEQGGLDPGRLSRRLRDALAELLGASPAVLGARPPAAALLRTEDRPDARFLEDLERLSQAALRPAEPPLDPLDRLFLGGPQG
jgi:transcriptional regulator with XRE-family HTH domain